MVEGRVDDLGKVAAVEVGFQYGDSAEATEFTSRPWKATPMVSRTAGKFFAVITGLEPGQRYEFQAVVIHPLLTVSAESQAFSIPRNSGFGTKLAREAGRQPAGLPSGVFALVT